MGAAVKQATKGSLDDRPLYWARNQMQTWLKRNPLFKEAIDYENSVVRNNTELENTIKIFEEESRNYNYAASSKTGNKKKILITGFDPFFLNSFDHPDKENNNHLQSNPSGVVALALDNNDELGAFIQTMIFPVRYIDFDGSNSKTGGMGLGVVEKDIQPFISEFDAIITLSQAGPGEYNIDVYGTLTRGGTEGNLNHTRKRLSKALSTNLEWIKTNLNSGFTNPKEVKYEWLYNGDTDGKTKPPNKDDKINKGSGNYYLSNEIFYRVGKMRTDLRPALETGHFHIAKIQNEAVKEDLKPKEIIEVLNIVKKSLIEGFKKLK